MKEEKTASDSKSYRNCKKIINNKGFAEKEQLLFCFVKRLYDRNPRKHKANSEESLFNDDIILLMQIIKVFYSNTAYDKNVFKDNITKLLGNLE
ncbi:MAG: hypothetical protein SOW08_10620 [Lachnospiraceae bacterium]|nr:hypothetical protein [Lachnospiraceae bacterium]